MQEIWDAVHKYHSNKNNRSKITQLVNKANLLQQGERSILEYANDLSTIFSEIDHYRPLVHSTGDRDYILMDRVYKLLQGLRPKFERRSQLYNRGNPLTFDDAVSQLMTEESRLQEMRGEESSACAVSQPRATTTTQPTPQPNANRRGPIRNKDNLWCNYCKRQDHEKEMHWKL